MPRIALLLAGFAATVLVSNAVMAQEELTIPERGYVVSHDLAQLPSPVREKREELLAAAQAADMGRLREIFEAQAQPPAVSFVQVDDPIRHLEEQSGDGEGFEMLAVLAEVLSAPYAAIGNGEGDPIYIWPYLAAVEDLSTLTPQQRIDGYRIMGYAGFNELEGVGTWFYWRAQIGADGQLLAFIAGD